MTATANESDECPLCGGPLVGVHCKLICGNCGYKEDCSDLFPVDSSAEPHRDDRPSFPPFPRSRPPNA